MKRLEYLCVVVSLALAGADRIDLWAGLGPFRLTPFLLFASIVVLIQIVSMGLTAKFQITTSSAIRRQLPYLALLGLFLLISFTSTIFGEDPQRGLVSLSDFALLAVLGYCISVRTFTDSAPEKLVVRSLTVGLIVYLVFCVGGAIASSHGAIRQQEESATSLESLFAPTSTFFGLPRLSGYCLDANRAGFILVMFLALLDKYAAKTRYTAVLRIVIICFILLTVSRSAMLCLLAYYAFSPEFWKKFATLRTAFAAAALAGICLLAGLRYQREIAGLLDLWNVSDMVSDRLSSDQGTSGADHIQLIQRGLQIWSSSTHTVIAGIGFAGAPRFLGDFFEDNKYGNFHSLYVSVLAELGLPAFLICMVLLGYPMIGRKGAAPIVAAIAFFNVALQSYMEPIFWLALALVWSFERKSSIPGGWAAPSA